jgi:transposase
VRDRLVSQRTGIINQIRAFLLERAVAVLQGLRFLRTELPNILATRSDVLSPRMMHVIEELAGDWHRLDERIERVSTDIKALADQDPACERLMTVPGIGPIISSAMVAAIGNGAAFSKGRDFGAWVGKSWIEAAEKRLHHNVLAIALANKLARIAWAVLNKERNFECARTNAMASRPS